VLVFFLELNLDLKELMVRKLKSSYKIHKCLILNLLRSLYETHRDFTSKPIVLSPRSSSGSSASAE